MNLCKSKSSGHYKTTAMNQPALIILVIVSKDFILDLAVAHFDANFLFFLIRKMPIMAHSPFEFNLYTYKHCKRTKYFELDDKKKIELHVNTHTNKTVPIFFFLLIWLGFLLFHQLFFKICANVFCIVDKILCGWAFGIHTVTPNCIADFGLIFGCKGRDQTGKTHY